MPDGEGQFINNLEHMCRDGCMFPNAMLETPDTWNNILDIMLQINDGLDA